MRLTWIRCLSLLCLGTAFSAQGQDLPLSCQVHANNAWVAVGSNSQDACLSAIETQVPDYNAQGFKFGLWGSTLLSADRYYYYQSNDQGATWVPLRLKAEATTTAAAPVTRSAPTIQRSTSDVINSVAADAQASGALMEPVMEPVTETVAPAAAATSMAAAPAAAVRASSGGDRRVCSLQLQGQWRKLVNLTLDACARELDRSPEPLDANGFKYAYWSGTYLAANQTEILMSPDSKNWGTLIQRQR